MAPMTFYTIDELKGILKLSRSQVHALIASGRLRCHRFTTRKNGCIRVSQTQLDAYLAETEQGGASVPASPTFTHSRYPSG